MQSVQEDLRAIKDLRKSEEKARDKYENTLVRFNAINKSKELPLVREDAFQLYESRVQYFQILFTYVAQINKFKNAADLFFTEKCAMTTEQLVQFMSAMYQVLCSMRPPAFAIKNKMSSWQKDVIALHTTAEQELQKELEITKLQVSPDSPFQHSKGIDKEGYLNKKQQRGIGQAWKRVYLVLKDGNISQFTNSKSRGVTEKSFDIDVLLCEIRVTDTDRRYCFELRTTQKSHVYQAETEEDMRDWMRTLENAKSNALLNPTSDAVSRKSSGKESSKDSVSMEISRPLLTESKLCGFDFLKLEKTETVLQSVSCTWGKDEEQKFGKMFVTEFRSCFAYNMFGQTGSFSIEWKNCDTFAYTFNGIFGVLSLNAFEVILIVDESFSADPLQMLVKNSKLSSPKGTAELIAFFRRSAIDRADSKPSVSLPNEAISDDEVTCGCENHLDDAQINIILPIDVDELFHLMYRDETNPIFSALNNQLKYRGIITSSKYFLCS